MKFRATIELAGKTATGVEVPAAVVTKLGSSRKPAVRVTIKGYTYRSTIATMGGRFMLPISAEVRQAAGVAAKDKVDVDVDLDTTPRVVTVPPLVTSSRTCSAVFSSCAGGPGFSSRTSRSGWPGRLMVSQRMKPRSSSVLTSKPSLPT